MLRGKGLGEFKDIESIISLVYELVIIVSSKKENYKGCFPLGKYCNRVEKYCYLRRVLFSEVVSWSKYIRFFF